MENRNGRDKNVPRYSDSIIVALTLDYLLFVEQMRQVLTSALRLNPDNCTMDRFTLFIALFSKNGDISNAQVPHDKFSTFMTKVGINIFMEQNLHYHGGVMKNELSQSIF